MKCVLWFYSSSSPVTGCQPFRFFPPRGSLSPRFLMFHPAIAIWVVIKRNDPCCVTAIANAKSSPLVATCLSQHLHGVLGLTHTLSRTLPIAVLRPGFALRINIINTDSTDKRHVFCVDLRTNSDYFPTQH